jgi:hypothetical protein
MYFWTNILEGRSMTAQQTHRKDVAHRNVVDHFLTNVVNQATYLEGLFHEFSDPNPPIAYYMANTTNVLDLIELQELLEMNEDEVIDWVSNLPEVARLTQAYSLILTRLSDETVAFGRSPFLGFVECDIADA